MTLRRSTRARQPSLELVEAAASGTNEFFLAEDIALAATPSPKKRKSSRGHEGQILHPTMLRLDGSTTPTEVRDFAL
jgi:hypothetical protein